MSDLMLDVFVWGLIAAWMLFAVVVALYAKPPQILGLE